MANIVNVTPIIQGSKRVIYHVYLKSDGASGELDQEILIDPVEDLGLKKYSTHMTLEKVLFHFAGFDARIEFASGIVDQTIIWVLPEGADAEADFREFGGLKDRSNDPAAPGKLLISTTGFTSSTDQGSMMLMVRLD